jgi:hypothetical protein
MQTDDAVTTVSRTRLWTGYVLSALPVAFLLLDAAMKLVKPKPVVEATVALGYLESVIVGLGIVLGACTIVYLIPRTSILGAILLTGYLGGAVASHLRHGDGWFPVLFPVAFGMMLWGGLCLRDERLSALLPIRTRRVIQQEFPR